MDKRILQLWQAARLCGKEFGQAPCSQEEGYCQHHKTAQALAEALQKVLDANNKPDLLHGGGRVGPKKR